MIVMEHVNKTFKVAKRGAGFGEAVKALFHREYTLVEALKNVSFTVNDGEMVGYIGPNGAGKSSTIKVMSGILTPDSGKCLINGRVPWKERVNHVNEIGVVFGQRSQLWWDVPVIDSLGLIKDIYRVRDDDYNKTLSTLTELLNLQEILRTPARQLSLGQRMRCEIAASLVHNPKILFLDEPTIGLDAVSKIAVREFIKSINKEQGTTVILTTHDMQDIEALAQRILLIGKGRILLDGTLGELKRRNSPHKTLIIDYTGTFNQDLQESIEVVESLPGRVRILLDTDKLAVSEAINLLSRGIEVNDISVEGVSAEDMVVSLYKEFLI